MELRQSNKIALGSRNDVETTPCVYWEQYYEVN